MEVHRGCTKVGKGTQWCSEMHGGMHKVYRWVNRGVLRCTEVTEGCAEVQRGVCRGVGRCMEGYVDAQRCMDRCAVVHGGV